MKKVILDILKKYKWILFTAWVFIVLNIYFSTYPSMIIRQDNRHVI